MIRYDNRQTNLRVVTYQQNNRNRTKQKSNTSGKNGVSFETGSQRWIAFITNNDNTFLRKRFSVRRFGNAEAKQMAIDQLLVWQREFGYEGQ